MIVLRLDRVLADRKMRSKELAEKIGLTEVNLSRIKCGKISAVRFLHARRHLPRAGLPARRHPRVRA